MQGIMKWLIASSLLVCSFCSITFANSSIDLIDCEVLETANQLTLLLKSNEDYEYHSMFLHDPERLVIDLHSVKLKTKLPNKENSYFNSIRSSAHEDQYLRLVIDLKDKIKFSHHFEVNKHVLSLVLQKTNVASQKLAALTEKKLTLPVPADPIDAAEHLVSNTVSEDDTILTEKEIKSKPVLKEETSTGKNIVIVIDPGHGGKDPGAAGLNGAREKDVVLQISRQLYTMLNQEQGFSAVLTRSTDCYLPLRKRLAIARKHHADMFVAVHADAYNHTQAAGASVYALSQRGATSEAAKWLAEKENESELGGLGNELMDKDEMLRSVLIDLSQTHTIESSLGIGNTVLRQLGLMARLHHPRVEQAAFVVLKSPDIPSILVETGFLSNPMEEEKLTDPDYQQRTAAAIKEGIKHYFITHSPSGTWFAENRRKLSAN